MQNKQITLEQYQRLNNSFKRRKLIFNVGAFAGFYSEFNNMVLAVIYCLDHKIKFSIYSSDANFSCDKGWEDYFLPFCDISTDEFNRKYNLRDIDDLSRLQKKKRKKLFLWKVIHYRTYLTFDVFRKCRDRKLEQHSYNIPELNFSGDLLSLTSQIINVIYRFNEQTELEINSMIAALDLPDQYVGLHIRCGDKFIEHEQMDCSSYIAKAEKLSLLRVAFVFTDDYRVIETLRKDYADWTFYTLTEFSERGYVHSDFCIIPPLVKRKTMVKLFASMEILRNSELFVGTFSANPGMFMGMCKEKSYGVDMEKWCIW